MNKTRVTEQTYSMQEIREATGLTQDTLRFYEKDGILADIFRLPNGHRQFSFHDLDWLKFVVCLRTIGMPLKDIRLYRELTESGDDTIEERKDLLKAQKDKLTHEIEDLQTALQKIKFKIDNYEAIIREDCSIEF